jgi:hypothetical protein
MQFIGLLFTLTVLLVNIWGMMLIAGVYWRNRWFALGVAPIMAVTAVYAVECYHGLGPSLQLLGLGSSLLSVSLIVASALQWEPKWIGESGAKLLREWRAEMSPMRVIGLLGLLVAIFSYAFVWRFTNPNIDASSEKIADLSFICSYYAGSTIPVPDVWLYPFPSTQYYSFQYYGAALMGRILMFPPGAAFNFGFCLLVALSGAAFSGAVCLVARKFWVRLLVIAAFVIGGSGVTLLIHLIDKDIHPWSSMRFIGVSPMDKAPLGPILKSYQDGVFTREMASLATTDRHLELPGENFSYLVYLGDFHPPLSGFYILGICVMGMLLWTRTGQMRYAFVVGCCLTWTLLANTWFVPLQGSLVLGWLAMNAGDWRRLLPSVAGGAAAVWLAAWVYLAAFTSSATTFGVSLKMVPWGEHTPPLMFLLFMLPTVALIILAMASGSRTGLRLGLLWLCFLVFSEFFYVKDIYSGMYDRFNTCLKWWPWVTAGVLMTLAPLVIEQSRRRWVQVAGVFFCFYPCFYIADLWRPMRELLSGPRDSMGQMDGTHFLTKDEFPRLMLGRLRLEKPGVVVERPDQEGAFTNFSVLPLFAGQRMWLGWFGHELLWHGYPEDIRRRHDRLMLLYSGGIPDAGKWLSAQHIDYVLWYRPGDTPQLWEAINKSVAPEYTWCDIITYQNEDGRRAGFWRHSATER